MPKVKLTDRTIDNLTVTQGQQDFWDTALPGFGIRVGTRRKTFVLNQNKTRRTLGHYPAMSLKDARQAALLALHAPQSSKKAAQSDEAVKTYLSTHHAQSKPRTAKEAHRLLSKHFLPSYGTTSVTDITTAHISSLNWPLSRAAFFHVLR